MAETSNGSAGKQRVVLEMSLEHANALAVAAEAFSRIGIGQLQHIAELVRFGTIPLQRDSGTERVTAEVEDAERIEELMSVAKGILGYPRNGSNGIGHRHVSKDVHRAWEVHKVLRKALAVHRNPSPDFAGVDYDGLSLRYSSEEAPVAVVRSQG